MTNPTACATPAQGTRNNGDVGGEFYLDNLNTLGHTSSYGYDSLNRLTSAVATGSTTYNLTFVYNQDSSGRYGNMSCQTNGQTQGLCTNVSFNPANNQINTAGYGYDAAGHMTGDGTHTYQYDAEGRLATVDSGSTQPSPSTPPPPAKATIGPAPPTVKPAPDNRPSCFGVFLNGLEGNPSPTGEAVEQSAKTASNAAAQLTLVYTAVKGLTVPLRSPYVRALTNLTEGLGLVSQAAPAAFVTYDIVSAEIPAIKANFTGQCQNNFWSAVPATPLFP